METSKKFRFDSFATEFACKDEKAGDDIADSDSGIDSEENQVSPPSSLFQLTSTSIPVYDQPLSLVLGEQIRERDRDKLRKPIAAKRHWKKFLKDQAYIKTEDFESQADDQRIEVEQSEAENLCLSDIYRTTESSVAQALLSLGRPEQNYHHTQIVPIARSLPIPVPPARREMLPSAMPLQPLSIKSLQNNSQNNICQSWNNSKNTPIKLPQHPVAPLRQFASQSNLYVPLQTMPLQQSSANHLFFNGPLKEIQPNGQFNLSPPSSPPTYYVQPPAIFSPSSLENCETLSTMTPSPSSLDDRPKQSKSSRKPYFCSDCKKGFSTQSGYVKHQQMHSTNQIQKNFSCKFCNKGYTSLSALKMHIRTHTLPCKCDICGKSFSRPWLLQGHVRIHTGEKPFSCNYCTRSFADKSNLRAHLQTHLQTKKYSCPGCQKTFSRMSLLNKHTDTGCSGLLTRNKECVQTLLGLSGGLIRT